MARRSVPLEEVLYPMLQEDDEFATEYLNAALEEDDPRLFLLALKRVIEARGLNKSQLAKEAKLSRDNLYHMLSEKGNPALSSLHTLLEALGFRLAIQRKVS